MLAVSEKVGRSAIPKKWRKLVCDTIRGYDTLKTAAECWFEPTAAEWYIEFIETCCTHIEGALAGKPFVMEPWERAIIANLFGWYRQDFLGRTVRRYRKVFIYVPRKNGKTPLAAAIHNAVFFQDDERGQVNNIAAASRDQASKMMRHIAGMIRNEPEMSKLCTIYQTTRSITKPDNSVTKVIPADENVAHGDNQHLGIVDELHAQKDRRLVDAMTTSMASANRLNPLMIFLTTADYDRPSICNEEYDYACKVRDGLVADPSYLPVIYEATEKDDWTCQKTWEKANPNLGVSVSLDYLRDECRRAKETPAYENTFKRLHLNMRTQQDVRVIVMDDWDACAGSIDLASLKGQVCCGALDIGAISDFTAFILIFGHGDGEPVTVTSENLHGEPTSEMIQRQSYTFLPFFWLPEKPPRRDPRMADDIDAWRREGYIRTTPGNVVDYSQVVADISEITAQYSLTNLAIDQGFQGMQITQDLQRIFGEEHVVAFRQGILSMAGPFRELLQLMLLRRLHHDGNPVMRWMAGNVAGDTRGGLTKPSKDKSSEKIDGITALTMAIGTAMAQPGPTKSVYEERGIWTA